MGFAMIQTFSQRNRAMDTNGKCTICGGTLKKVEAALNRTWGNVFLTSWGSSQLQIRLPKGPWHSFMKPSRNAEGLFCERCGALTLAPTIEVDLS